jgi:hypothetical protein
MTYAIIGDVHSQGRPLELALAHCKENNLTPILLGDLFDSRCVASETISVWHQARSAQRELGAIILNSNHQVRLIEAISGGLEYGDYCLETFRTLDEFAEEGMDLETVSDWLKDLPDGFVFRDDTGREHCCAHAYFPITLRQPNRQDSYTVHARSDEEIQKMVWGPYNQDGRRFHWWKHAAINQTFTRVAGHYHKVLVSEASIILDSNAGYRDGYVPLYEVDAKNLIYFNDPSATIKQKTSAVA